MESHRGCQVCRRNVTGICRDFKNRLLTPCHTRLRRPPRGPFRYQGVSTRGVRHSPVDKLQFGLPILNRFYCDLTNFCASRYGISGDSMSAIGAMRDSAESALLRRLCKVCTNTNTANSQNSPSSAIPVFLGNSAENPLSFFREGRGRGSKFGGNHDISSCQKSGPTFEKSKLCQ